MADEELVGRWINVDGDGGRVRYVGPVDGSSGTWLGVEWSSGSSRGKHDGRGYFKCTSKSATCASFIRRVGRIDWGQGLVAAARSRYITDAQTATDTLPSAIDGRGRGKISAVGFDVVAQAQSDLATLSVLGLGSMRVYGIEENVGTLLRGVRTLQLSRNYMSRWRDVVRILECLPGVQVLDISGNHMEDEELGGVGERTLDTLRVDTSPGVPWTMVSRFADRLGVRSLSFGWSQATNLTLNCRHAWLKDLFLDYNQITDLQPLAYLPSLQTLSVRGNTQLAEFPSEGFAQLRSLNVGYTGLNSWTSVSNMHMVQALYVAFTPLVPTNESAVSRALVIGRLPGLSKLDGTEITFDERTEMERYYLTLSDKEFPRVKELTAKHGPLPLRKAADAVEAKIGSRLVAVTFRIVNRDEVLGESRKSVLKSMLVRELRPIAMRLAKTRDFSMHVSNDGQWLSLDCDTRSLEFYGAEPNKPIVIRITV
ncbi:hypothetical protein GGI20_001990 [Coemansia sp. BCRC 34301]|nr:hypothetical protein GGI20_001990 [Coemansia sp. BCRC 34301]